MVTNSSYIGTVTESGIQSRVWCTQSGTRNSLKCSLWLRSTGLINF